MLKTVVIQNYSNLNPPLPITRLALNTVVPPDYQPLVLSAPVSYLIQVSLEIFEYTIWVPTVPFACLILIDVVIHGHWARF